MLAIVFKEILGYFVPLLCISYTFLPVWAPFSIAPRVSVPTTGLALATSELTEITDDSIYGVTFSEKLNSH